MIKRILVGMSILVLSSPVEAKEIIIDLKTQRLTAKNDNGKVFLRSDVSTGTNSHPTPVGKWSIYAKVKDNKSTLYPVHKDGSRGGAKMPYTLRVVGAVAIHQGYIPRFMGKAYPDSHGCIRVPRGVAKKLYYWTSVGTKVRINGSAPDSWNGDYQKAEVRHLRFNVSDYDYMEEL